MSSISAHDFALTGSAREQGFWSRLGAKVVDSRRRQADRAVASYLLSLDDETLTRLGYSRSEIQRRDPAGYPFL